MCQVLLPLIEVCETGERLWRSRVRDLIHKGAAGERHCESGVLVRFSRQYIAADWAKDDKHSLTWQRGEALVFRRFLLAAVERLRVAAPEQYWSTAQAFTRRLIVLDEWLDTPVIDRIAALDDGLASGLAR